MQVHKLELTMLNLFCKISSYISSSMGSNNIGFTQLKLSACQVGVSLLSA